MFSGAGPPVGGENGGYVEIADCLIFTSPLKVISIRHAENAGTPGKPPFSDLHGYFRGNAGQPDR
jgi:hypothetical protein